MSESGRLVGGGKAAKGRGPLHQPPPPPPPPLHSKQAKLLKTIKFDPALAAAVDLTKVNWRAVDPWIERQVAELLGVEDDVLTGYITEQLQSGAKVG